MAWRVVIADDARDLREMLRLAVEMDGEFEVVAEAANGEETVEAVRTHRPDAVLLDVAMPLMDGLDAIPAIRAAAPGCRILVLSGYGDLELRAAVLRAGAGAYVLKGARPREVVAALHDLMATPER